MLFKNCLSNKTTKCLLIGPGTPARYSLTKQLAELEKWDGKDMYRWMQKQQEYSKDIDPRDLHYCPSLGQESFLAGKSEDDASSLHRRSKSHPTVQMVDAQVKNILLTELEF